MVHFIFSFNFTVLYTNTMFDNVVLLRIKDACIGTYNVLAVQGLVVCRCPHCFFVLQK